MLRRRPDDTFELLLVERAVIAARPARLSEARREALRARIVSALGVQAPGELFFGLKPSERWVAIPAGLGVAAAIFAAARLAQPEDVSPQRQAAQSVPADGIPDEQGLLSLPLPIAQDFLAASNEWRNVPGDITVGLGAGTRVRYDRVGDQAQFAFAAGDMVVATRGTPAAVVGDGWRATLAADSVAMFTGLDTSISVFVAEGSLLLAEGTGMPITLPAGSRQVVELPRTPAGMLPAPSGGSAETESTAKLELAAAPPATEPALAPSVVASQPGIVAENKPGTPSTVFQGARAIPAPSEDELPTPVKGATDPDPSLYSEPSLEVPVGNAPSNDDTPALATGSNSNMGGSGNGNAGANSNAGGNGSANAGANSNAGGNGNGNAGANSNAGGNGNGNAGANSNAGGNGNGNAGANSNAGGNGNGNGNAGANSNAGGNGNGKGNSGANSNSGGNGKGKGNSGANSN